MNLETKDDLWVVDHINKCRCCFQKFNSNEERVKITDIIEEQFLELTKIELQPSPSYSNIICLVCTNELQSISSFRLNLIKKQQKLYQLVTKFKHEVLEEFKFDPVCLKIERQSSDEFGNPYDSESCDGNNQIPKIPVDAKTKKKSSSTKEDIKPSMKVCKKPQLKTKDLKLGATIQCQECKKVYQNASNLARHIRLVHLKQTHFSCDYCDVQLILKKEMTAHMKQHFPNMVAEAKRIKRKNEVKSICPHCGRLFQCAGNLSKHIRRVHLKQRQFSCDLCKYTSLFKNEIVNHMKTHLPQSDREKLYCDQCPYATIIFKNMKSHLKTDHGPVAKEKVIFECYCGKMFTSKVGLDNHVKYTHEGVRHHLCQLCYKSFVSPSRLKLHMAYHTGRFQVPCDVCGKVFVNESQLRKHSIYHKEPRFSCDFLGCTKKFHANNLLENHKKTHIEQRDFACQMCDKKYFKNNHLQRHIINFHQQLKVRCEIPGCNSIFARKETYRNHVLSHHKDLSEESLKWLLRSIREMRHTHI